MANAYASSSMVNNWDPLKSADWDSKQPSVVCLKRVSREVQKLQQAPPAGIFVQPDEDNVCIVHCLIVGPDETPYEGGFFYFVLRMPPDYPLKPPRVRLMTTGNDSVRFNPNLYANGKVCLSILGTWTGPSWVASLTVESVLLSIQSLMSNTPYTNEPGYENQINTVASKSYNLVIQYESLRVAVCEMLEGTSTAAQKMPPPLTDIMKKTFVAQYAQYVASCDNMIGQGLQGKVATPNAQQHSNIQFDPAAIKDRLANRLAAVKATDK